jgi:predicted metal-dependent HD superfamily phosphohydrolase
MNGLMIAPGLHAWGRALAPYGSKRAAIQAAYDTMARHYTDASRVYHTWTHIAYALFQAQRLLVYADAPHPVLIATWLHDVIYDPQREDNEAQSAACAADLLRDAQVPATVIAEVERLILLTQAHECEDGDGNGQVISDSDLAILGEDAAAYARYAQGIAAEYAWMPAEAYREGRRTVLCNFLARPSIYYTPLMREEREERARENLERELASLQEAGQAGSRGEGT